LKTGRRAGRSDEYRSACRAGRIRRCGRSHDSQLVHDVTVSFGPDARDLGPFPEALGYLGCQILKIREYVYGNRTDYYRPACIVPTNCRPQKRHPTNAKFRRLPSLRMVAERTERRRSEGSPAPFTAHFFANYQISELLTARILARARVRSKLLGASIPPAAPNGNQSESESECQNLPAGGLMKSRD
jgi:hypothetical protein